MIENSMARGAAARLPDPGDHHAPVCILRMRGQPQIRAAYGAELNRPRDAVSIAARVRLVRMQDREYRDVVLLALGYAKPYFPDKLKRKKVRKRSTGLGGGSLNSGSLAGSGLG